MQDSVVFLCQEHELTRERRGYYRALSKRVNVICAPLVFKSGHESLERILPKNINPILILHPESFPRLPHGLVSSNAPTACFQIDTYSGTEKRIKWSMLYDYAFVFHPEYDRVFEQAGHPQAIFLPHAVEAELFQGPGLERIYDVGWVGSLQGKFYSERRRCIAGLKSRFRMNDTDRYYSPEELAALYRQSKIVVNISRDDYLSDANLRCFEVMAAGALLITAHPTELTKIGFREGIHFVHYLNETELYQKTKFFIDNEGERRKIAEAAQDNVLKQHTYDNRAETILDLLGRNSGKFVAPARSWKKTDVHALYLHYFAKHLMLDAALRELREIKVISRQKAVRMWPTIGKAVIKSIQISV